MDFVIKAKISRSADTQGLSIVSEKKKVPLCHLHFIYNNNSNKFISLYWLVLHIV